MNIEDLFRDVEGFRLLGASSLDVSGLSYRSSDVGPGHLFFCVPGFVRDGHEFGREAVERGAVVLCVERDLGIAVPQVVVPSVRRAMGPVSAAFFGWPSGRLTTVGITGTNGKTTSGYLLAWLFEQAGIHAGLLGTVEKRIGGVAVAAVRTTPEAVDIQRDLAAMVRAGDRAAVLEVSSHALELGRVYGMKFAAAAFTNLTQDHLDFHLDLDAYFKAKSRLFFEPASVARGVPAVLNLDDERVGGLADRLDRERVIGFSLGGAGASQAGLLALDAVLTGVGSRFRLVLKGSALEQLRTMSLVDGADGAFLQDEAHYEVETDLVGRFNVANVLTAFGLGLAVGLDIEGMVRAVGTFPGVPGRMEAVNEGQPFAVLVDYAHSPDAVASVLRTAGEVGANRVIGVLGCGGDRDRGKRPKMGRALEEGADIVVITSDNPRSEDPLVIIEEMAGGLRRPAQALVEPDRRAAIGRALALARTGDMVLILGKGHEAGQQFACGTLPFDDREVARSALRWLGWQGVEPPSPALGAAE